MIYKITTDKLIKLNSLSVENGYNKWIPIEVLRQLDVEGWHVLRIVMDHNHKQGNRCPIHHRCMVWLKIADEIKPAVGMLDIPYHSIDEFGIDITEQQLSLVSKLGGSIDE